MVNLKSLFEKSRYGGTGEAFKDFHKYRKLLIDDSYAVRDQFFKGYGDYENPYVSKFLDPLNEINLDKSMDLIQRGALSATDPASISAAIASRNAAGGRGGLAYSGGAGALAARGAASATTEQSSALANALLQGEQLKIGLAGQKAGLIQSQAQFEEGRFARLFEQDARFRELLLDQLGTYGLQFGITGLQGQQAANAQRGGLFGSAAGAVAAIGAGAAACWVAREIYGSDNPKWLLFRRYLLLKAPRWLTKLYMKYGERFANWLKKGKLIQRMVRPIIKRWMDRKVAQYGC